MAIQDFIRRVCVQNAIYWQPNGVDGFGKSTFFPAVDISCRWDDCTEKIVDRHGVETVSNAQLLVTQDIDVAGYLKLGKVEDLQEFEKAHPIGVKDVFPIKKIEKTPEFRSTDKFVRIIYL